jgi:hypothetical protein
MKIQIKDNLEETIYVLLLFFVYFTINKNSEEQYFLSSLVYFVFKINAIKQLLFIFIIVILANLSKTKTKRVLQMLSLFSLFIGLYHSLMTW